MPSDFIKVIIPFWILQLIGHYKYEKKKPSFLTGVRHLVIGPVWLLSRLLRL